MFKISDKNYGTNGCSLYYYSDLFRPTILELRALDRIRVRREKFSESTRQNALKNLREMDEVLENRLRAKEKMTLALLGWVIFA